MALPSINIKQPIIVGGDGPNTMAYSYDALNWYGLGNKLFTTKCNDTKWNGDIWVAVGSGTNNIGYSYNGIDWYRSSSGNLLISSNVGIAVAWSGTNWIAVGQNNIMISSDGINWTNVINPPTGVNTYNCICWNGTVFLIGGNQGTIYYSSDGNNWTVYNFQGLYSDTIFSDVKWSGFEWYLIGKHLNLGIIFKSSQSTPTNWAPIEGFTDNIYKIAGSLTSISAYVGDGGGGVNVIRFSTDGNTFDDSTNSILTSVAAITWDGYKFIAVGSSGSNFITYSYDANIWYPSLNGKELFTNCYSVSSVGPYNQFVMDKQFVLTPYNLINSNQKNQTLDLVNEPSTGNNFENIKVSIKATYNS